MAEEAGWLMEVEWDETDGFMDLLERFAIVVARHEREACINKIQAEINHALLNNHRLELKFGQARGDRAVRMSALEASLDWLRDRGEKP